MNAPPSGRRVAVVGGGYAGFAAAVTLAGAGFPVTVFERARTLGGRARRVAIEGLALDNGQHLAIGAYSELLRLLATVHGAGAATELFRRLRLTIAPFGSAWRDAVALRAWPLPAPLDVAAGILAARGLSWRERLALAADFRRLDRASFRCPPGQSVAECFATTPRRAFDAVWSPLCLAALNTPPERASAQVFAAVLAETFAGHAGGSDFLIPAGDLSALFPEAAARYVAAHGGEVRAGVAVRRIEAGAPGVAVVTSPGASADAGPGAGAGAGAGHGAGAGADAAAEAFAAVIVAVGPHQLAALVGNDHASAGAAANPWQAALAQVSAFGYESITTAWLAYPAPVALAAPIARLDDAPGQWVFDRSGALAGSAPRGARALLAVVISGSGPHDREEHPALAARIDAQLRRLEPALPPPAWARIVAERRATYACTPGLDRPAAGRIAPGRYLAGDYSAPDLPPTLEAAVRSGVAAARALQSDLG